MHRHIAIATALVALTAVPIAQSTQSPPAMADLTLRSAEGAEADWLTDGGDPQRTAWQKNEHILNVSNVKGMTLLWKYKTDNVAREMHALFPPLIVGRVITAAGPKQVAIVAGISDNIYAIDVATGGLLWK